MIAISNRNEDFFLCARTKRERQDRMVALAVVGSLFLPWVVSIGTIWVAAVYVMVDYRRLRIAVHSTQMKGLLLALLCNVFAAAYYQNTLGVIMVLGFFAMVLYGSYLYKTMTHSLFHRISDFACLMSVAGILVAVIQKLAFLHTAPGYRPVSFYFNANYFGMMIEFTVLLTVYRAYTNRRGRPFYAAVVLVNLIGLYLCGSLSALAAMTAGVLLFLLLKRRYKVCAAFLLLVLLFLAATQCIPALLPREGEADTSFAQRLSIWHGALQGIADQPLFGHGMMSYFFLHDQFGTYATFHCHNLYLEVLLDFGIFGACIFAITLGSQILRILRRIRAGTCGNAMLLVLVSIGVVLVHGMTDVTIFWTQTGMLFLFLFSASGIRAKYGLPDAVPVRRLAEREC